MPLWMRTLVWGKPSAGLSRAFYVSEEAQDLFSSWRMELGTRWLLLYTSGGKESQRNKTPFSKCVSCRKKNVSYIPSYLYILL